MTDKTRLLVSGSSTCNVSDDLPNFAEAARISREHIFVEVSHSTFASVHHGCGALI